MHIYFLSNINFIFLEIIKISLINQVKKAINSFNDLKKKCVQLFSEYLGEDRLSTMCNTKKMFF